jgi:uncharacterized membrane protein YkoI
MSASCQALPSILAADWSKLMNSRFRTLALICGLSVVAAGLPAYHAAADPDEHHGDRRGHGERYDHDAVRAAVEGGEIKPLAQLLDQVKGKLPGEITGVEVERKHGLWVYEFRVIDKEGRLFDVYVDAQSGEIKSTKEK